MSMHISCSAHSCMLMYRYIHTRTHIDMFLLAFDVGSVKFPVICMCHVSHACLARMCVTRI